MYIYYIIIVIIVIQFTIKHIIIILMIQQQQCCIDYALIDLSSLDPPESGKRIDLKYISSNIIIIVVTFIIPLHYA